MIQLVAPRNRNRKSLAVESSNVQSLNAILKILCKSDIVDDCYLVRTANTFFSFHANSLKSCDSI